MILLIILALLALLSAVCYLFLMWNYDFWRKRSVKYAPPKLLFGTFPSLLTQKQHFADDINDIYKTYKDSESYVGIYLMRTPQLMLLDPALAHQVFVTAFNHFEDNSVHDLVDKKKDPLIANNPFLLRGPEWREQRALITPGMTSTRIRDAYAVMQQVCHSWCDYIEQEMRVPQQGGLNGKDLALRYTSESICDSVLGIKAKSFTADPLPIADNVKMFSENNTIFIIYSVMAGIYPNVSHWYKAKFFPETCERFFLRLMEQAFSIRQAHKVERQDIMNHLLTMQQQNGLSDIELASHTMTFLIDGLDTTASTISHCLLLLARNVQAQATLLDEILRNVDEKDELSFEKLNELPYLDACIHESLRIFPPGLWSLKNCTEPFEFTNKSGETLQIKVDEQIMIPIYSFHHDPNYYAEPEEFQPERFMPENGGVKKYRRMGVYLGFGDGPRACLGMRFALVQSKAAVAAIVKNFHIKVNPRTTSDNKLDPKAFLTLLHGGVWLDFEKRA